MGCPTLFVRFGGCDLRCRWCDSPHTWRPAERCRIEEVAGRGRFHERENPVPVAEIVAALEALALPRHRFVSLTGGEPLLQVEAVRALAEALRGRGPRVFLETHGAAVEALERVAGVVDVVSMDWKLTSDVRRESDPKRGSVASFHEVHEAFLRRARQACEVLVKLVVTPHSEDAELEEAWARIAAVDAAVPVILQPVTPTGGVRERPGPERLLDLQARASERLRDVRIIPQTHAQLGVR